MSAPWDQSTGFGVNTLSNPYDRLMNTSGIGLRDHAGSMVSCPTHSFVAATSYTVTLSLANTGDSLLTQDLCNAALQFASDTLQSGGHFICKFYQGSEDKAFEALLRRLFTKVHREKPESSRKASPIVAASSRDREEICADIVQDSREAFFVALRRRGDVRLEDVHN